VAQKSLKLDLSKIALDSRLEVRAMTRELEGKESSEPLKAPSGPRWGLRFSASGLKSAPRRR
jgi:hypothetical protein